MVTLRGQTLVYCIILSFTVLYKQLSASVNLFIRIVKKSQTIKYCLLFLNEMKS